MKDLLGNEVKPGDVMLELGRGGGSCNGSRTYNLKLWEMPEIYDGHAYYYSIDESVRTFAWASVGHSIKVDMSLMPDGFEYSFKHGMSDITTKIEYGTLQELIENSDWKQREIKKEDVERFKFMRDLKIEKVDDIVSNIEELKKGRYTPREIILKVLNITGVDRTGVKNGESGIAGMFDQLKYQAIIEALSKNPKCFEKAEA